MECMSACMHWYPFSVTGNTIGHTKYCPLWFYTMERVLFGHQTFSATAVCWCRQSCFNFWGNCKGWFYVLFMYKLPQWQLHMYIVKYCIDWTDGYSCCLHALFILPLYGDLYPVVYGVILSNLHSFLLCNLTFLSGSPLLTWGTHIFCSSDSWIMSEHFTGAVHSNVKDFLPS